NLAHFAILDLGPGLVPEYHQQNHVRVTENGAVLMETTPDSGHDYDGVVPFDVTFPIAGAYRVETLDAGGRSLGGFNGTVADAPLQATNLTMQMAVAPAGAASTFTYETDGASGHLLNHT